MLHVYTVYTSTNLHHFYLSSFIVGISLEKSSYNVVEGDSVEVCAVLSGTILPTIPFFVILETLSASDSGTAVASRTHNKILFCTFKLFFAVLI